MKNIVPSLFRRRRCYQNATRRKGMRPGVSIQNQEVAKFLPCCCKGEINHSNNRVCDLYFWWCLTKAWRISGEQLIIVHSFCFWTASCWMVMVCRSLPIPIWSSSTCETVTTNIILCLQVIYRTPSIANKLCVLLIHGKLLVWLKYVVLVLGNTAKGSDLKQWGDSWMRFKDFKVLTSQQC